MSKAKKTLIRKTIKTQKIKTTKKSGFFNENLSSISTKLPSFDTLQTDLKNNKNIINLILGGLIVVIFGVLLFNFASKQSGSLGPATQTTNQEQNQVIEKKDVAKESLPGKYTIKEGDTLFTIAEQYYGDGYLFNQIKETNKILDENLIGVGQVLEVPKLEQNNTAQNTPTLNADKDKQNTDFVGGGTGGAENQTIWGEKISGDTYTVQAGDWLSKIAGRAYGDVYSFEKIAQANNLTDPNLIEPGTVIKLPR